MSNTIEIPLQVHYPATSPKTHSPTSSSPRTSISSITSPLSSLPPPLEQRLGLWSGMGIVIGSIVGSGIFATPSLILEAVGSPGMSMVIWIVGALVSLCGCISYMELGTMLPKSGGEKEYLAVAYPRPRGLLPFLFCITSVCIWCPAGAAADGMVAGTYFVYSITGDANGMGWWEKMAGVLCVLTCGVLHGVVAKFAIRVQSLVSLIKIILLVLVIVVGVVARVRGGHREEVWQFHNTSSMASSYSSALFKVFFTYSGYTSLNYSVGELRNPSKNLPRAALGGLGLVAVLYVLCNLSYLVVLTPDQMSGAGTAVAGVYFAETMGRIWGQTVVPVLIGVASFGNVMCVVFAGSRILFAATREGYLPGAKYLGRADPHFGTPLWALALCSVLASVFIVAPPVGRAYDFLIDVGGYPQWIFYGLAVMGLIIMRWTHESLERPFRSWWTANLVTLAVAGFMCVAPFVNTRGLVLSWAAPLTALLFILASIPAWYWQIRIRRGLDRINYQPA